MEKSVSFYSDGVKIAAVVFEPDNAVDGTCPGIVLCQGVLGVKEYWWFPKIARQFADMGCVALIWDYPGAGESEGDYRNLYPLRQADDTSNALTYLEVNPKVDPERLALYGSSFGGALVPYVAGVDERVKCAISVAGFGDGERWMRSARRHYEWQQLVARMDQDRKSRVLTGQSELMGPGENVPREAAVVERRQKMVRKIPGMESYSGTRFSLATAQKTREFKPIDVVERISPRAILYIAGEKDTVTTAEAITDMYNRTKEPKKLWIIPGIEHDYIYEEPYMGQIFETTADWLRTHLHLA